MHLQNDISLLTYSQDVTDEPIWNGLDLKKEQLDNKVIIQQALYL